MPVSLVVWEMVGLVVIPWWSRAVEFNLSYLGPMGCPPLQSIALSWLYCSFLFSLSSDRRDQCMEEIGLSLIRQSFL